MAGQKTFERTLLLGLAAVAAVLLASGVLSYQDVRQLNADARRVAQTRDVLDAVAELRARSNQALAVHRAFLLTGDEAFSRRSRGIRQEVDSAVGRVSRLTARDPRQQARVSRLKELVSAERAALDQVAAVRRAAGTAAAAGLVSGGHAAGPRKAVGELLDEMAEEEEGLLRERRAASERAYATARVTGLTTPALGLAAVGMFLGLVHQHQRSRARAAAVLRRERAVLEATLASIADGVITTDADGRVRFLNGVAGQLTGWTLDEARVRPLEEVFRIVTEDARLPVDHPAKRALRDRQVTGLEGPTLLIAKDGTETPIDERAAPIRDADGAVSGAVLVFRDVTVRRAAEAAQQRVLATLESLADGVWRLDRDWRFLYVNGEACRSVGLARSDLVGRTLWEAFPALVGTPVDVQCRRAAADRVTVELEHFYAPLGRWFGVKAFPTEDGGLGILTRDVSEQKRAEEALKEADRRKDEFIATLAHELRNPLAPVRNAVQVLKKKGTPDPEVTWAREVIERQVAQMARLLDDLLDVSRLSLHKLRLRKGRVTLASVIDSALETSRPLIDAGRHELRVTLPDEPVHLDADPVRLAQVFANLLNNAAKYTDRGGVIRLTAERGGGEVVATVKDTGIGIAAEVLPRIFETFSQATPALERAQGGLGIGLSLVRGLVELHGGSVVARSDGPGAGSEFTVRLPAAAAPRREQPPGGVAPPSPAGCRIVAADDCRDAADSLAMLLRLMGNEVRTAGDGQEAVEVAEAFRPDVALLDIGMPRLNGYEVARRIREQPWGKDVFLVALTGWGQEEDRRRSQEAGFNSHLVKPVDPAALEQLLGARAPRKPG
jgi:PAS domain S-box-containing protein